MSLVFTLPGKIGDALLQWPVARQHCLNTGQKCQLWLDQGALKPLVNLFAAQPEVLGVELKPGITSYHMGGQPWDFGLRTDDFQGHEVHHLGMRKFPSRQITLETATYVAFPIDHGRLATEQAILPWAADNMDIRPTQRDSGGKLILHGTFRSHTSGVPGFWRFFASISSWAFKEFEEVVFVGTSGERDRAVELYPKARGFDDGGDFLELARHMATARLVIGSGSSGVVLAGALKVPAVRVHDPIGGYPKVIWSNLGSAQINETERDLRAGAWDKFRDKWLSPKEGNEETAGDVRVAESTTTA